MPYSAIREKTYTPEEIRRRPKKDNHKQQADSQCPSRNPYPSGLRTVAGGGHGGSLARGVARCRPWGELCSFPTWRDHLRRLLWLRRAEETWIMGICPFVRGQSGFRSTVTKDVRVRSGDARRSPDSGIGSYLPYQHPPFGRIIISGSMVNLKCWGNVYRLLF